MLVVTVPIVVSDEPPPKRKLAPFCPRAIENALSVNAPFVPPPNELLIANVAPVAVMLLAIVVTPANVVAPATDNVPGELLTTPTPNPPAK